MSHRKRSHKAAGHEMSSSEPGKTGGSDSAEASHASDSSHEGRVRGSTSGSGSHIGTRHGQVNIGNTYGERSFNNRPVEESVGISRVISTGLSGPIGALDPKSGRMIERVLSGEHEFGELDSRQFEQLVATILEALGAKVQPTPQARDGGRDLIARMPSGIEGADLAVAVEVKHRKIVDRPTVQMALHQNRHFPALMLVTSGRFTKGALVEARQAENRRRLFLKDGKALLDMLGDSSAKKP